MPGIVHHTPDRSPKKTCAKERAKHSLRFKIGPRSRPATDQEIDLVARTIVERLQQGNWLIQRGPTAPLGSTPGSYGRKED
jgi:hypothetical protein